MSQEDLRQEITQAYTTFNGLRTQEMLKDESYFPIPENIREVLFKARQNYIRYFAFSSDNSLKKTISNENIIEMHSNFKEFSSKHFPNNDNLKYLKTKILEAYMLPEKFAGAIQNYFIKSNISGKNRASNNNQYEYLNKDDIPIFANVIIPSIYGYFIEESQACYGFDFICFLFQFEYEFYMPFFLSYLMSATTFLDIFWDNFFTEVTAERISPSLYQLKEMFCSSLKSSIPFFSAYHIQLLKNCLLRDYNEFFNLLFTQFIFPSFSTYNRLSLIPQKNMDLLHEYIIESVEFTNDIQQFFHQYNFVDSQKVQFLNNSITVILSHYEANLLFDLFQKFDKVSNLNLTDQKKFDDIPSIINRFSPYFFDVSIENNILMDPFKRGPIPHVFNNFLSHNDDNSNEIIPEPKIDSDTRIAYALLKVECEENRINPQSVISNTEEISPGDTFKIKQLKNKYKDYQNLHSLETKSIYLMKNDLEQSQKEFFSFLLQMQRIRLTDDIKFRIQRRFNILEEQFYSNFDPQSKVQPITVRSIVFIPKVIDPYFEYRPSFVKLILSLFNVLKFNEFLLKNKQSFQKIVSNVNYFDSIEISERLVLMERNLTLVYSLCQNKKDWTNPIFLKCFSSGALRVLYETFILTMLYQKQNADNFKIFESQIKQVVNFFQYILDQLRKHVVKNPDDEDIKKIIEGIT